MQAHRQAPLSALALLVGSTVFAQQAQAPLPETSKSTGILSGRRPVPVDVSLPGREEAGAPSWPSAQGGSVNLIGSFTNCPQSISDQVGAGCLRASSVPTLGMLYPLSEDLFVGAATGNVGMGTSSPEANLHLESVLGLEIFLEADTDNAGASDQQPSIRFSQNAGNHQAFVGFQDGDNHFAIRSLYQFGGLRFDIHTSSFSNWEFRRRATATFDVEARITRPGDLQLDGSVSSPAADLAEFYPVVGQLEPGDVVAFAGEGMLLERARPDNEPRLAGVISSRPAFTMGFSYTEEDEPGVAPEAFANDERYRGDTSALRVDRAITHEIEVNRRAPLALAGRVPVKVTAENGRIWPGDLLTVSSLPGHAMRATEAGPVIGTALQAWDAGRGKILVFVNVGWHVPVEKLARLRDLELLQDEVAEIRTLLDAR